MTYVYEDEVDDYLAVGYTMDQLHVLQFGQQRPQEPEFNQEIWERTMRMNEIRKVIRGVLSEAITFDNKKTKNVDSEYEKYKLSKFSGLGLTIQYIVENWEVIKDEPHDTIVNIKNIVKGYYRGDKIPCIKYSNNPEETYPLIDGFHRLTAMKILGIKEFCYKEDSINEAITFDNNKTFTPPPNVAQRAQEAINTTSSNNLTQSGTGHGSGLNKAKELASKQTQGFDMMKKMKSFFETSQESYNAEKAAGKTVQNSGIIQAWELHGGDSGKEWVNQQLDSLNQSNLNTKSNLRKAGGAGENKGMGIFDTKVMKTNNHRIHR
jgi:hypothetical protein